MTVDWTEIDWGEGALVAPERISNEAELEATMRSAASARIVTELPDDAEVPVESFTVKPGEKLPATVGVPAIVPPESRAIPVGNAPLERDHL